MTSYVLPLAARVQRSGWPAIWLPLVLLWPLIIAVFCLALPLCLFMPAQRSAAVDTLGATYRLLCALRGTSVELGDGPQNKWSFALY